jgi:hypothetical protein
VSTPSSTPVPVEIGDVVRLKKAHPCGGKYWNVVRVGAEIGLTCTTCGRKIMLPFEEFERRIVKDAS